MKITTILTSALAASALLITSCDKEKDKGTASASSSDSKTAAPAVSEKEALETFKKGALEVDTLVGEMKAAASPKELKEKMTAAAAKLKSLSAEGLPADLKEAFLEKKADTEKSMAVLKDLPETEAEAGAFMQKLMTDPAMVKLQADSKATGKKFTEVAAKHGIELKNAD